MWEESLWIGELVPDLEKFDFNSLIAVGGYERWKLIINNNKYDSSLIVKYDCIFYKEKFQYISENVDMEEYFY